MKQVGWGVTDVLSENEAVVIEATMSLSKDKACAIKVKEGLSEDNKVRRR